MSSYSSTKQSDERVDLSALQTAEQLVLPGSQVTEAASVGARAGDFSNVWQTVENQGFQAEDVAQLLGMINEDQAASRDAITQLGTTLASGLQSSASETAQILAATKSPEVTSLSKLMPLLIVLAVLYFLMR